MSAMECIFCRHVVMAHAAIGSRLRPAGGRLRQRERVEREVQRGVAVHARDGAVPVHVHRTHRDDAPRGTALDQRPELCGPYERGPLATPDAIWTMRA